MLASVLSSYSRREILRRPGRSSLTVLGVALGVAAFVAVAGGVLSTRAAYTGLFTSLVPRPD